MPLNRNTAAAALLLATGSVNLAPGVAGLLPGGATILYGVQTTDQPALELLLRHRSVLLAMVGAGLLLALVRPGVRPAAIGAAATSMASFVVLQVGAAEPAPELTRVAIVDVVALIALVVAWRLGRDDGAGSPSRRWPVGRRGD